MSYNKYVRRMKYDTSILLTRTRGYKILLDLPPLTPLCCFVSLVSSLKPKNTYIYFTTYFDDFFFDGEVGVLLPFDNLPFSINDVGEFGSFAPPSSSSSSSTTGTKPGYPLNVFISSLFVLFK